MPDVTVGDLLDIFKTLRRKRKVRLKIDGQAPLKITRVTIEEDESRNETVVIEVEKHVGRGA